MNPSPPTYTPPYESKEGRIHRKFLEHSQWVLALKHRVLTSLMRGRAHGGPSPKPQHAEFE